MNVQISVRGRVRGSSLVFGFVSFFFVGCWLLVLFFLTFVLNRADQLWLSAIWTLNWLKSIWDEIEFCLELSSIYTVSRSQLSQFLRSSGKFLKTFYNHGKKCSGQQLNYSLPSPTQCCIAFWHISASRQHWEGVGVDFHELFSLSDNFFTTIVCILKKEIEKE